jgi:hypothetical protein
MLKIQADCTTKDYENIANWKLGENKPNQTQFQKGYQCCSAERCLYGGQVYNLRMTI